MSLFVYVLQAIGFPNLALASDEVAIKEDEAEQEMVKRMEITPVARC